MKNLKFLIFGIGFGIVLTKAEVISWFRIQEMFRFQSFHMYGIIGSAIVVGAISVWLLKKFNIKDFKGEEIVFLKKPYNKGFIIGGILFGLGWALTGACPGPIFALIGNGYSIFIVTMIFALFGTWIYGLLKEKLPH
jgi:uncharacterized membrane protein YedE/YeeE